MFGYDRQIDHADLEDIVREKLVHLKENIDRCSLDLQSQAADYPMKRMDLSTFDSLLKDFVRLHHLDSIRKIQFELNQLNGTIEEKRYRQRIEQLSLNNEQVCRSIDRSIGHWFVVVRMRFS